MNKLEREFLNSNILKEEEKDWREELAKQKFEYKKQQDLQKQIEKQKEYNRKKAAQNTAVVMQIITILLKVCFWICFAPILIIGFFFIGFFKAVLK